MTRSFRKTLIIVIAAGAVALAALSFMVSVALRDGAAGSREQQAGDPERAACASKGGKEMVVLGLTGSTTECVLPRQDEGKICRNSKECEGDCILKVSAQPTDDPNCEFIGGPSSAWRCGGISEGRCDNYVLFNKEYCGSLYYYRVEDGLLMRYSPSDRFNCVESYESTDVHIK